MVGMDSESPINQLLYKYKWPLIAGLVGVVLLLGGIISSGIIPKTFNTQQQTPFIKSTTSAKNSPAVAQQGSVTVDVSGEVANPGVYVLSPGARIEEAIKSAGGVTESADPVFVTKTLNLAQKVVDGMKIYIPKASEAGSSAQSSVQGVSTQSNQTITISINAASLSELDKLPGVGEVTAQKIIDGRPYGSLEELVTKKAVTRSVYEKIKNQISTY